MEEILSSIKRIIAEESAVPVKAAARGVARGRTKAKAAEPVEDEDDVPDNDSSEEVLELTDALDAGSSDGPSQREGSDVTDKAILSDETAAASRSSLAALSALIVRPDDAPSNTLEGLVCDMLRPMMREWLDANLPDLVEKMVAKEIARLTERQF